MTLFLKVRLMRRLLGQAVHTETSLPSRENLLCSLETELSNVHAEQRSNTTWSKSARTTPQPLDCPMMCNGL